MHPCELRAREEPRSATVNTRKSDIGAYEIGYCPQVDLHGNLHFDRSRSERIVSLTTAAIGGANLFGSVVEMDLGLRLQLRRRLIASRQDAAPPAACSEDGAAAFRLFGNAGGICVELRRPRPGRGLATHAMLFESEKDFLGWCDTDPLRFSNPVLHAKLKRHGCALLAAKSTAPTPA
jgi:hypothetical protein